MGSPSTGEIYEGQLRPGDVGLDNETARRLKEMIPEMRIADLQERFRKQGAIAPATDDAPSREMPRYKCHKEVWALKIADIQPSKPNPTIAELEAILADEGAKGVSISPSGAVLGVTGAIITPLDAGYAPFEVDAAYVRKHDPHIGGYYVVYSDGYKSYSPAQAFEEGYTRQ